MAPATKLLQRKLYTFVSSRWGLPVCIIGLLLLFISIFQFGEVFLQWSKERYSAQFSVYHDNIAGKSFEKQITPELPIDIVYTWVNGTDPVLIRELNKLKDKLKKEELERTKKEKPKDIIKNNTTNTSTMPTPAPPSQKCPFKDCVPWRVLVMDAYNLSFPSLDDCRWMFPSYLKHFLSNSAELFYFNSTSDDKHITAAYGLRLESEEHVTSILSKSFIITQDDRNISITRGYLTSDGSLLSSIRLPSFFMIMSPRLLLNDSSLIISLRNKLNILSNGNILEFMVVTDGVGVVRVKTGNWTGNTTIHHLNHTLTIVPAHVIWIPFKLPDDSKEAQSDTVAANRFMDNEELRYSLRSVEKYAPWIRHIYIVTNGQIPHWLDLENPRISIVSHEEIYLNKSHLPSYSSPSIESHLHRIPGLSKWFLYLNDDVMFGQEVWPHDFFTPNGGGQKVYLSWSVPNCAEGCPPNWIHDKYCDKACNNSDCEWDGGDCANASRAGPVGGAGHSWAGGGSNTNTDYCNTGCMPTWVGDRYCDNACNVPMCGYDGGDCGVDNFINLYHITLTPTTPINTTFKIPFETKAMYVNLSSIFINGSTFTSAEHTPSSIIRTAVVSRQYKTLSITFHGNNNSTEIYFNVKGKYNNDTLNAQFKIRADTVSKNTSLSLLNQYSLNSWSFTAFNDTKNTKFLNEVVKRLQKSDHTIDFWIQERTHPQKVSPVVLSPSLTNYTVTNISKLPQSVAMGYTRLRKELKAGELTMRGYLKRLDLLLGSVYQDIPGVYRHKVVLNEVATTKTKMADKNGVADGSDTKSTDTKKDSKDSKTVGGGGASHIELLHDKRSSPGAGVTRKLLELSLRSHHWLPWERLNVFPDIIPPSPTHHHNTDSYRTPNRRGRNLLDTFGDSLRHVNKLYNKAYGHKPRKVPAHMPHMINKEIMQELQDRYEYEFDQTSSHQLRSSDDMQYAFSYFYFIIGETVQMNINEVFDKLDTDKSGILSVRELRTLLVKLSSLPLGLDDVEKFENMLRKCGRRYNGTRPSVDPMDYETHYDPDLPLITKDFVLNCSELYKKIEDVYGKTPKYGYEEMSEDYVAFKMLQENSSKILAKLDEVRKDQRIFICLNDNMDHSKEESKIAQLLLRDFYESLFPIPSQFELPSNYRNRFLYTKDLKEWSITRKRLQWILYGLFGVLIVMLFGSLFYGKIVQLKRRITKLMSSFYQKTKSHRIFTV